jgi:hypothetical protein
MNIIAAILFFAIFGMISSFIGGLLGNDFGTGEKSDSVKQNEDIMLPSGKRNRIRSTDSAATAISKAQYNED